MKEAWVILTKRHGGDVRAPTEKQLADALNEVFIDHSHGAEHESEDEPGSAILRFGYEEGGHVYELEVMSCGTVTFEELPDQDSEFEMTAPKKMFSVSKAHALELWCWLAHRQVAKIRSQPWLSET